VCAQIEPNWSVLGTGVGAVARRVARSDVIRVSTVGCWRSRIGETSGEMPHLARARFRHDRVNHQPRRELASTAHAAQWGVVLLWSHPACC
jgi:hypothetical protein